MAEDKQWASKYLLDPLTAPEPSDETGPGTHHVASAPRTDSYESIDGSNGKYHPSQVNELLPSTGRRRGHTNPKPLREAELGHRQGNWPLRQSEDGQKGGSIGAAQGTRRRGSSLNERFPGDQSHRPLDMLKHDAKTANRSPHLRKKHQPGKDSIDSLDNVGIPGGPYHHDGPFDAALLARNTSHESSPLEALRDSNAEALKATPSHYISDSLTKHRPIDGTAILPPGSSDDSGNQLRYEEGSDLMIEDGANLRRWPGVSYQPGDIKGEGEPAYSVNKALKDHDLKDHRRMMNDGESGYEMTPQAPLRKSTDGAKSSGTAVAVHETDDGVNRSGSKGGKVGEGLKKRFGSLRRNKDNV
ncbi:MAG: hypothetical protein M1837_007361 [Sclerophora amabilis]|nr:MAG: hypothetical protein M1837_007361 [Sclerophora amabilis]